MHVSHHVECIPEAVAVKEAQVPVVYHVPPLMIQPLAVPPLVTGSVPLPLKGVPGVGLGGALVAVDNVVEGGAPPETLGRYFIPVAGQSDLEPSEYSEQGQTRIRDDASHLDLSARTFLSGHYHAHSSNTKSRQEPSCCIG